MGERDARPPGRRRRGRATPRGRRGCESKGGHPEGSTTQRGCGSKVTATAVRPARRRPRCGRVGAAAGARCARRRSCRSSPPIQRRPPPVPGTHGSSSIAPSAGEHLGRPEQAAVELADTDQLAASGRASGIHRATSGRIDPGQPDRLAAADLLHLRRSEAARAAGGRRRPPEAAAPATDRPWPRARRA